jgi:hypothetical protein
MSVIASVFQYRAILGKLAAGTGLDWDEIEQLPDLEAKLLQSTTSDPRSYCRHAAALPATLRGDGDQVDDVTAIEISAGGLECLGVSDGTPGDIVEIMVNEGDYSYRFSAAVAWIADEGTSFRVGLAFLGAPLRVHVVGPLVTAAATIDDRLAA